MRAPYGIVTETDIVYKVAAHGHDPKEMRVYQIMTKPCIVVTPELGVEYVARLFATTKIRQAPVVQERLLGVISITDILCKSDFVEKPKTDFYGYGSYIDDPEVLQERKYDV